MNSGRFYLGAAMAAWRRSLEQRRTFSAEDLDELEQHLRDQVAELVGSGMRTRDAFRLAMREMGDLGAAETEYRKVYWGKRRRRGEVLAELTWRGSMLKNYVKIALRTLSRQKGYAFINIFGLALGLACFVLILLFVQHERSYDQMHENGERIYRVVQERPTPTGSNHWAVTSPAFAGLMESDFPEVQAATTVGMAHNPLLSVEDRHFQESGIEADADFFDLFSFPLLRGNRETILSQPGDLVLSASLAAKMFGEEDPIGKTVLYQNSTPLVVRGIMAEVPPTSHLSFDFVVPAETNEFYPGGLERPPWYNNGWYTYVRLAEGTNSAGVESKIKTFIDEGLSDWRPQDRMTFTLQPLEDIHLHSEHLSTFPIETSGSRSSITLFLAIGCIILLLACVNYTNLAVARSIRRSREVGLRQVVGATRRQLIGQFLGESVLTAFLALLLAVGLIYLMLPVFVHLVERPIEVDYIRNPWLLPGLLALVVVVGFLSGSYPAFVMGALRPIHALSGPEGSTSGRYLVQRILVVGQYAVAVALVAGSFVVYQQMQYVRTRDLGYDRDHILTVQSDDAAISQQFETIRNELLDDPHVDAITYSSYLPTGVHSTQALSGWEGASEDERLPSNTTGVDYDFLGVFDIDIIAGRGFSRSFATDTFGAAIAIVNEETVRRIGWTPENAIGKEFGYSDGRGFRTIIGVMEDVHYNSVHRELEPFVLTLDRYPSGFIAAKVRPGDLPATVQRFETAIAGRSPYPFEYAFMDQRFDQIYREDIRLGEAFGVFTLLAILIASLGLFGLAAYITQQRTREIGIRKVLGAGVPGLVMMLSGDFLKLVGIAILVAAPPAYLVMSNWLDAFVYRIDLGPGIFLLAGVAVLVVAVLTVSTQAVRVAFTNPVKSLKYE